MNYQVSRLQRQLDDLRSQNQQIAEMIQVERQERTNALIASTARGLQGLQRSNQLLTLLQGEKKLVEQAGMLMAKTDQGLKPVAEALPELLKSGEYDHFRAPTAPTSEKGRFLQGGDRTLTSEELQQVLSNPDKSSELFDEVQQGMGQPAAQRSYDSVRPQAQQQPVGMDATPSEQEIEQAINDLTRLNQLAAMVETSMLGGS